MMALSPASFVAAPVGRRLDEPVALWISSLTDEVRCIALAAALRGLGPFTLEEPGARRGAFCRAGLGCVSAADGDEALRRERLRRRAVAS